MTRVTVEETIVETPSVTVDIVEVAIEEKPASITPLPVVALEVDEPEEVSPPLYRLRTMTAK